MKTKASERLRVAVHAYLESIGAKRDTEGKMYEWYVNTKYGVYRITVYETWIAGRFDEKCDLGGYSGKYNFHLRHKFEGRLLPDEVKVMLEWFQSRMRMIYADKS